MIQPHLKKQKSQAARPDLGLGFDPCFRKSMFNLLVNIIAEQ